jgi:hypothetical protein
MNVRKRSFGKVLIGAGVLLSLFGVYESVDAAVALFRPLADGPLAELLVYPGWSLLHFVPGVLFMGLAPLQLWASFRNRHRTLHRWSGRIVVASSLCLFASGAAFPFTMPERPVSEQLFMAIFAAVFLFFLIRAFAAARRRDFASHRVWMIRLFATGLTITTQRLMLPVFIVLGGVSSAEEFWRQFVAAAWVAWAIQIAVAEWWVRAQPAGARRVAAARQPEAV